MKKEENDLSRSQSLEKKGDKPTSPFSPQGTSQMSNFFNPRGPIKPQNLYQSQQQQHQLSQAPQARDFLRMQQPSAYNGQQMKGQMYQQQEDDEYYGEEEDDDYGNEGQVRTAGRQFSPEQEKEILKQLLQNSQRNNEFLKVLSILQQDIELKPLIFEHKDLLNTLKDMLELKAEQMLSILTAAETEMYENSKIKEEQQQINKSNTPTESKSIGVNLISNTDTSQIDDLLEKTQTAHFEIEKLKRLLKDIENEKMELTAELYKEKEQRELLEKEQECAFKNLTEENKQLKKMNETLKKIESDTKMQFEQKEKEYIEDLENLKINLRRQEELRMSMLQDHNKIELDLQRNQNLIENLANEINLLEKDNENLHRKMHITYNSLLFSQQNQQYQQMQGADKNTPPKRNLSQSFQASGYIDGIKQGSMVMYPGIGQSTQRLKLLMSDNKSGNSFVANSLYYAHYGAYNRVETLPRSNSIDVILLDDDECKKQNQYPIGEEEKSNISGMLQNKASWLKTKGLFTDLSPIRSLSSQNIEPSSRQASSYQQKQKIKKLHDVEEEQTEILGTYQANSASPYPSRFYDEQVRKLQSEVEKLKEENNLLTQKIQTQQYIPSSNYQQFSPLKSDEKDQLIFATPQNTTQYRMRENTTSHHQFASNQMPIMINNDQSPLMMATFSKEKDRQFYSQQFNQFQSHQSSLPKHQQSESERERYLEQQYERLCLEFKDRLQELGGRLIQLFKKLYPQPNEISHFNNQEFTVSVLKDIIYEISVRIDSMSDQQQKSRTTSYGAFNQMYLGGNQYIGPQSQGFGSQNNSTIMEMTPVDIRNLILEEKEKRLLIQEELNKTREQQIKFLSENEKLKQDLYNEKQHNQTMVMSNYDYHSQGYEQINKLNQNLQQRVDNLQDENVTLKLKISEIEDELLNERQNKQLKYEVTMESFKSNIQGQYLDQKIRFEEQLLQEKETSHKLKVEIKGLLERNELLKDQLALFRERIIELERESIQQSKENYVLQNELDYENLRTSQLQTKQDKLKTEVKSTLKQDIMKIDQIIMKYENKIKEMQFKINEQEILLTKQSEIEKMTKERFEDEIYRIKSEYAKSQDQLQNERFNKQINNYTEQNIENLLQEKKKYAIMHLRAILKMKDNFNTLKRFYHMKIQLYQTKQDQVIRSVDSFASNVVSESNIQRVLQLEEQVNQWQYENIDLIKQIAKILRYVSSKQPIKLCLSSLVTKFTLDYILSGLKQNSEVYELNLSKCNLDNDDLKKIYESLRNDQGICKLKIGNNKFTNAQSLLDLLMAKGRKLKAIDITNCKFEIDTLTKLPQVIRRMESLQELTISGIIHQKISSQKDLINQIIDSILSIKGLQSLDISNNQFQKDNIEHLLYSLRTSQNIESIALNNIGLNEEVLDALLFMISNQRVLKRFNISQNNLQSQVLTKVLNCLSDRTSLEELDLSKCQLNNDNECYNALSQFITSNKDLRSLSIQKVLMNEESAVILISSLSQLFGLEYLKLDFNQIGPFFVEKLVKQLLSHKLQHNPLAINSQSQNSLLDSDTSSIKGKSVRQSNRQGLIHLSLEGNKIGDRGALAIAELVRTPCERTKALQIINLNDCGISNEGIEELTNALKQRANLAASKNLTHVKITINRNEKDI